jgi:1,4-dihydroxy-2-naphthoate octaprenyltransferase
LETLNMPEQSPNVFQVWLLAARPKTLPAAAAPVLVGTAVAVSEQAFNFWPALAALLGAFFIQIGANLANDVFDFKKGADTAGRLGPVRVTQAGLLTPRQVLMGMWVAFGSASLAGLYLIWVGGWPVMVMGILSIISGIIYTGGPFPIGYKGLGDLFAFIFFGVVAVCGTYYVQAGTVSAAAGWASIPVGLLATAILVVNNLRDIDTDREAGKKTLAVRLGVRGTQIEYLLLVAGSYVVPPLMGWLNIASPWVLLTWLSVPLAVKLWRQIRYEQGRALNKALAGTARLELVYALLLSAGIMARRLG